jgi:hypothetical protein
MARPGAQLCGDAAGEGGERRPIAREEEAELTVPVHPLAANRAGMNRD